MTLWQWAHAAALTGRGRVRATNQDAVSVFGWLNQSVGPSPVGLSVELAAPALCAVADGIGGHAGGEVASALALTRMGALFHEWSDPTAVVAGVAAVSDSVHAAGRERGTPGMGTTVAGVVLTTDAVLCFNVGDSRVYRLTDGYLEQLSVDDNTIGPDGAPTNVLTQAVGDPPGGRFEPHVVRVEPDGDPLRLLLCTDGVSGMLEPALLRTLCRAGGLSELIVDLRDAVYEAGAHDNLSVVAIDVGDLAAW